MPFDSLDPLTSNSDLNQILDIDQSSSAVPQLPCYPPDGVWNTPHHEEKIRLLRRNSTLSEFPFPPVVNHSSHDKTSSKLALPPDFCPPPPKRRGRKRKARLSEVEKEEKHRQFLERNRLAASKCRAKKKNEIEYFEERKRVLERENPVLRAVLQELWDEVRVYRKTVMSHASCKHADPIEWAERNAGLSAALDARCRSLLGEESGGGGLGRGESLSSSIDDSAQTSSFSEGRRSGRSSISSFTSRPPSPASTQKDSAI